MAKDKVTGSHGELIGNQSPPKSSVTKLGDLKPAPGGGDKTKPGSADNKR